jgi:hypothetical protein
MLDANDERPERPNPRSRYVNHLYQLLDEYIRDVDAATLRPSSKTDYAYFAELFVRWCADDFEPGMGRQTPRG